MASKRLRGTQGAWQAASKGVRRNVTPEEILSLFPPSLLEDAAASDHLQTVAKEAYKLLESEFGRAWSKLAETGSFATFSARATELDALEAVAEARLHAGQPPSNTYANSADPDLTVAAATVPLLRDDIASMRARRQILDERNDQAVQSVLDRSAEAEAMEASLRARMATIAQVDQALSAMKWPEEAESSLLARSNGFS